MIEKKSLKGKVELQKGLEVWNKCRQNTQKRIKDLAKVVKLRKLCEKIAEYRANKQGRKAGRFSSKNI